MPNALAVEQIAQRNHLTFQPCAQLGVYLTGSGPVRGLCSIVGWDCVVVIVILPKVESRDLAGRGQPKLMRENRGTLTSWQPELRRTTRMLAVV